MRPKVDQPAELEDELDGGENKIRQAAALLKQPQTGGKEKDQQDEFKNRPPPEDHQTPIIM